MTPSKISEETVTEALRNVLDPEIKKDLVTLGMVKNIEINGSSVCVTVQLTTPACPLKATIKKQTEEAIQNIPGVTGVEVVLTANVTDDGKSRELLQEPIKNIIAVASGKGGVGKSTVAVNIAVALAKTGATVGLLDADIYGPNVPTMMGIHEIPDAENGRINPPEAYGVKVMSIGFMVQPGQPLIWRGPLLHKAIQQFIGEVNWGKLDYLVVDLPPGTGDAQLSLMQSIELSGGVIVTLPQDVSIEDASRGLNMFQQMKVPVLGVIENMSYLELPDGSKMDIFGAGGGEKMAQNANVKFLGAIPIDAKVRQGGDSGKPVVIDQPESPVAAALEVVAQQVAAQLSIRSIQERNG